MTPIRTNRVYSLLTLLTVAVVACGLVGCGQDRPPRPKSTKVIVRQMDKPAPPAPPAPPELPPHPEQGAFGDQPTPPKHPAPRAQVISVQSVKALPAIRLTAIRSKNPHQTKELALADALTVARIELMKHLELLDPPIHTRPSMVTMKTNFLKGDIREIMPSESEKTAIKASGLNANVRWVEIDLELTEGQIQKLRSAERVTDGFRIGSLVFALIASLYGFLRLDQWTKGYLTMWLGLGAGAAVVFVALMVFG